MKQNIKHTIYIFTLFMIFVFLIVYYYMKFSNKTNVFKIDEIYLINLTRRPDRLTDFMNKYNKSDMKNYNVLKFDAVDGSKLKIESVPLSEVARAELKQIETTGFRSKHYQLTRGAIGCYLSHVTIWKDILDNNIDKALIFEDDINIPLNGKQLIEYHTTNIPEDYDIILLGCNCLNCEKKSNYRIVKKFWGTYAYIITRKCIEKIYNRLFPIKQQIDSELSDLSNELNIYSTITNIIPHANIGKSDIQIPLNNTNILESFKNYQ